MPDDLSTSPLTLASFGPNINAVVFGASGGIGAGLVTDLETCPSVSNILAFSRSGAGQESGKQRWGRLDLEDEESISQAAEMAKRTLGNLQLVIAATGILHDSLGLQPEKSWRGIAGASMERAFRVNTVGPALLAKHFLPLLSSDRKSVFAAISARVGSIEDNQLGGWHSYRASKAALNMTIKTLSIELARRNPMALCVALHPGTVDTALSKPFQGGVPEGKLFSGARSARHLLEVLENLTVAQSGGLYAWDGNKIPF